MKTTDFNRIHERIQHIRKIERLCLCPLCAKRSALNVLGEKREDGSFVIERFHEHATVITGDNIRIRCSKDEFEVYYQHGEWGSTHK